MKERPILFSGPMVRAILEGRKTQTRRVVKPQPEEGTDCPYHIGVGKDRKARSLPYGQPGDRLWVRETWCQPDVDNLKTIWYRADADDEVTKTFAEKFCTWKPSIHMPRRASRIILEITNVRAERLQNISEADCEIEIGVKPYSLGDKAYSEFKTLWTSINGPESWNANPFVWVVEFKRLALPS